MNPNKRVVNFRYFVVLSLTLIAVIFIALFLLKSITSKIIFLSVAAGVCLIIFPIFVIKGKKCFAVFVSIALLAVLPIISLCVKQDKLSKNLVFEGQEVLLSGRICENYRITKNGNLELTVDSVKMTNGEVSKDIYGKFKIYTSPQNLDIYNYKIGCFLETLLEPTFSELSGDSYSDLSKGVVGFAYCNYYDLELTGESKLKLSEKVRKFVYQKLKDSGAKHYDIGYAMLFGDTSVIDSGDLETMRSTGIAHLLAVSGLHISLIVMLFSFILKKLKASKLLSLTLVSIILAMYCYVCNFSVSVVRASIMSVLSLYAVFRGKPYDSFSALGFTAYLILLVNPLKLFNISFILSFGAVLSIILTSFVLTKLFSKVFYKKFASTLAVSVGVQCGLIFTNLCYFGEYPLLSVVSNLISIPIQSFAFLILLVALPFCLILPFKHYLLLAFGNITEFVLRINAALSKANLYLTATNLSAVIIPLGLVLIFILSDKLMCKFRWKAILSALVITLIIIFELVF